MTTSFIQSNPHPSMPAPPMDIGPGRWLRREVFSSPQQAIATLVGTYVVYMLLSTIIDFAIVRAVWIGTDKSACTGLSYEVGACWPFIWAKLGQLTYGFYPADERWRVNLVFVFAVVLLIPLLVPRVPYKLHNAVAFFGVLPVFAFSFLYGGPIITPWLKVASVMLLAASAVMLAIHLMVLNEQARAKQAVGYSILVIAIITGILVPHFTNASTVPVVETTLTLGCLAAALEALVQRGAAARHKWALFGLGAAGAGWILAAAVSSGAIDKPALPVVPTSEWGGLFVTLVVATTGIVASLPIGIVLALARRSEASIIRTTAVIFIEVVRGVPLITVLFFATYMLPLFLENSPDAMVRVLVGISLFSGAYMAETIRGGLQAIPSGQHEAAAALGLNYSKSIGLIVLPQALRLVIPGIVNSFIGLVKDTTLVSIVAIFDLLGGLRAAFADPNWAGPSALYTGFAFAGIIYFSFCYLISSYSAHLEQRLRVDHGR
ncbi:amino acid ABC transporter permease [Microvirga calopogonii]|uniref:amino acid ABC transporter permease n=1 Tax=Microvirga calopogonii TaxID=2078013 RepID=UPI000E0DE79A|nr:amino acid ABC transporter permease [Microvirga calopogonii]